MDRTAQCHLEEFQQRNYSSETIRGYISAVRELAEH